jgi:hypothetical protein
MSQFFSSPTRPDVAAGAIAQHLRVKTTGALAVAGATDVELGTMEIPATAAGPATVRLRNAPGTAKMVANAAITAGLPVYAAAGGKVAPSGTVIVGTALEAATADLDVIEVLRTADTVSPFGVQDVTADATQVAGNTILPGINAATMIAVANDADDFVVLPALASVPNGFAIRIIGQANSNFEVRTPASSNEKINAQDSDGTKEYLFTKFQIHTFIKYDNTAGWVAHGVTALGAVVTPVVPD